MLYNTSNVGLAVRDQVALDHCVIHRVCAALQAICPLVLLVEM